MQTLKRATDRAAKLANESNDDMAVVHCGSGRYTVKRASIASGHYPASTRRTVSASGSIIENAGFDRLSIS